MGIEVRTPWPMSDLPTMTVTISSGVMRIQALGARPSMVLTGLPWAAESGVMQERTASPSRWTVQAPQRAMPQPYLVPVSPSESRSTQRSGVSGLAFAVYSRWFTLSVAIDRVSSLPSDWAKAQDRKGLGSGP